MICPEIITLDAAVDIVRELQPGVMDIGYYLALAGGTLNKGLSTNDIDLVAVPRGYAGNESTLIAYLESVADSFASPNLQSRGRPINVHHYMYNGVKLDIAVVSQLKVIT